MISLTKRFPIVLLALVLGCATDPAAAAKHLYDLTFDVRLLPKKGGARVTIELEQSAALLREVRMRIREHLSDFGGDGTVRRDGDYLIWEPPRAGGTLKYFADLRLQRAKGAYDALVTDDWAIFRGEDVFPGAATRVLKGARSRARLIVRGPDGWSAVTPYPPDDDGGFQVRDASRSFDHPAGWIVAGKLGVRRALIADTRVAIAAPVGQGFRRMDVMAFLRWTLPAVREVFPLLDSRVTIVGAGDPMWRGGLSGPASLFLHASRPLISENGTSTLLHELVHVAMGLKGKAHDDWIVEGLAEYYSLEILRRTGTLDARRIELALEDLAEWGADVDDLFRNPAGGEQKARGAVILSELDAEIARVTSGKKNLDDVVRALLGEDRPLTFTDLCTAARAAMGTAPESIAVSRIPGASPATGCETGSSGKNKS